MSLYRDFPTQESIDAEYEIERTVPDMAPYARFFVEESQRVCDALRPVQGVPFGPTVDEYLDIFPAGRPGAPVLVFIHGGYWRAFSNREFNLVAAGPVARGWTVVTTNYSLCPKVGLGEITRQSRAAIKWIHQHIAEYNGDPERIVVAGHSAGGQQVGMLLATDWAGAYAMPEHPFAGAIAISGLFDLRPLRYSFVQPMLQLDGDTIERESPLFHVRATPAPILVTVGGDEPGEFRRQSAEYFGAVTAAGNHAELWEQPGKNHFYAIDGFLDADSPLCERLDGLLRPPQDN